jgi:hypothetical protein
MVDHAPARGAGRRRTSRVGADEGAAPSRVGAVVFEGLCPFTPDETGAPTLSDGRDPTGSDFGARVDASLQTRRRCSTRPKAMDEGDKQHRLPEHHEE